MRKQFPIIAIVTLQFKAAFILIHLFVWCFPNVFYPVLKWIITLLLSMQLLEYCMFFVINKEWIHVSLVFKGNWAIGDKCVASYSGDGKQYRAVIRRIQEDKTGQKVAEVWFKGYTSDDNELVKLSDLQPLSKSSNFTLLGRYVLSYSYTGNNFTLQIWLADSVNRQLFQTRFCTLLWRKTATQKHILCSSHINMHSKLRCDTRKIIPCYIFKLHACNISVWQLGFYIYKEI